MIPKGSTGVDENNTQPSLTSFKVPSVKEIATAAGFKFDGNAIVVVLFITGLVLGAVLVTVLRNDAGRRTT